MVYLTLDLQMIFQDGLQNIKKANKNCFTFKRRPVELIFCQEFNDVNQAIYFEKKIKNWSGKKKLAMANGDFEMMQILAECKNASHSKYKPENE